MRSFVQVLQKHLFEELGREGGSQSYDYCAVLGMLSSFDNISSNKSSSSSAQASSVGCKPATKEVET